MLNEDEFIPCENDIIVSSPDEKVVIEKEKVKFNDPNHPENFFLIEEDNLYYSENQILTLKTKLPINPSLEMWLKDGYRLGIDDDDTFMRFEVNDCVPTKKYLFITAYLEENKLYQYYTVNLETYEIEEVSREKYLKLYLINSHSLNDFIVSAYNVSKRQIYYLSSEGKLFDVLDKLPFKLDFDLHREIHFINLNDNHWLIIEEMMTEKLTYENETPSIKYLKAHYVSLLVDHVPSVEDDNLEIKVDKVPAVEDSLELEPDENIYDYLMLKDEIWLELKNEIVFTFNFYTRETNKFQYVGGKIIFSDFKEKGYILTEEKLNENYQKHVTEKTGTKYLMEFEEFKKYYESREYFEIVTNMSNGISNLIEIDENYLYFNDQKGTCSYLTDRRKINKKEDFELIQTPYYYLYDKKNDYIYQIINSSNEKFSMSLIKFVMENGEFKEIQKI